MKEYAHADTNHSDSHHSQHCWPIKEGFCGRIWIHPCLTAAEEATWHCCRHWPADLEANIARLNTISYYRAYTARNTEDNMAFAKMLINLLLDQIQVSIIASLPSIVFWGKTCFVPCIAPSTNSNLHGIGQNRDVRYN